MYFLIGLLVQLGGFGAGLAILISFITADFGTMDEYPVIMMFILFILCMVVSGIGRRLRHLDQQTVYKRGLVTALKERILCSRALGSIIFHAGICVILYGTHALMADDNLLLLIILGLAGLFVAGYGWGMIRVSCKRCGARLYFDGEDYDNSIHVEHTSNSSTAYQYSTDYYHCGRCGFRTTLREKHVAGKITYH